MATLRSSALRIIRTAAAAPTRSKAQFLSRLSGAAKTRTKTTSTMAADAIKPWPTKMVESHGDYREEEWLEELDHTRNTTYQNQSTLPKLPVPSIEDTLKRFLPTALPLAESKDEEEALKHAVAKFPAQAQNFRNVSWRRLLIHQTRTPLGFSIGGTLWDICRFETALSSTSAITFISQTTKP